MARIIDKDTRLIDADFGQLKITMARAGGDSNCQALSSENGEAQLLNLVSATTAGGSFIQYQRLDLDYMARNNEIVMPTEISVQRTSPVPLGYNNNGNTFDQIEEYVYVLSRPLNNTNLISSGFTYYNSLRSMGLDGCEALGTQGPDISGAAGWPTQAQTIYAEKRMYSYSDSLGASVRNGQLFDATAVPPQVNYNEFQGMPVLDSVTSWGSMGAITGPNLHVYRIVINRAQTFPNLPDTFVNMALVGDAVFSWPALSVRFLCKDPNYSEGEYLTRLANAMNNTAEDGPTA
ncbi:MAG: hypothetical protein [Circular genetic element sp.]|nr:MAG: hypothetical protein [Circular genetic element sp.]